MPRGLYYQLIWFMGVVVFILSSFTPHDLERASTRLVLSMVICLFATDVAGECRKFERMLFDAYDNQPSVVAADSATESL